MTSVKEKIQGVLWIWEVAFDEFWWAAWAPVRKRFEDRRSRRFWNAEIAAGRADIVSMQDVVNSGNIGFIHCDIITGGGPARVPRFYRLRRMFRAIVGDDFWRDAQRMGDSSRRGAR